MKRFIPRFSLFPVCSSSLSLLSNGCDLFIPSPLHLVSLVLYIRSSLSLILLSSCLRVCLSVLVSRFSLFSLVLSFCSFSRSFGHAPASHARQNTTQRTTSTTHLRTPLLPLSSHFLPHVLHQPTSSSHTPPPNPQPPHTHLFIFVVCMCICVCMCIYTLTSW